MKTEWDYTELAEAYLNRPQYADTAIDKLVGLAALKPGDPVCDVGAGVAHLTLKLLDRKLAVTAVEPNDSMRALGRERAPLARWHEATGEDTCQPSQAFAMVTFGSSFNVTDRQVALREAARILRPAGWFACMWNHRDLEDPVQRELEEIIRQYVPEYDYGTRREDQSECIETSGLFKQVHFLEGSVQHQQSLDQVTEAWRSHATLQRQAGSRFGEVIEQMHRYLSGLGVQTLNIPYTTRIWCACLKD